MTTEHAQPNTDSVDNPYNHQWESRTDRFLGLVGEKDAVVDTRELAGKGFLWQYRKKYGYAATVALAKEWVETLAEHYSIPAKDRWLTI